jgi:hypothetical protein
MKILYEPFSDNNRIPKIILQTSKEKPSQYVIYNFNLLLGGCSTVEQFIKLKNKFN